MKTFTISRVPVVPGYKIGLQRLVLLAHRFGRKAFAGLFSALTFLVISSQARAEARKPNVLIFLTDDESWLERSIYGWSKIPTPNFDRVAKKGVLFTRGYTSAPSCAPSRASLLTGRNFWELEQGAFIQSYLPAKFKTLPELLEAGGYFAGYTGKGWGPGQIEGSGRNRNPAGTQYATKKIPNPEEGLSSNDYAANFEEFLKAKPDGKPFYFWLGSVEPHTPCAKDNHQKLAERFGIGLDKIGVPGFLPDTNGVRRSRGDMLYEVCRADENLGKILDILEKNNELDNTLVIVTADNGTQVLRSKTNVYDWGVHVPFAVMWPAQVKPDRKIDDFVNFIDVAPTVLQAAKLPVPSDMTGRSFLDILESGKAGRVDQNRSWTAVGLEWHGELPPVNLAGRMIRDERYVYIVNYSDGPRRRPANGKVLPDSEYEKTAESANELELVERHPNHPSVRKFVSLFIEPRPAEEFYDSEKDPWLLNNVATLPEYAEVKQRLKSQLEDYQRKTNDPRVTGDMKIFEETRKAVEDRKAAGYGKPQAAEKD